MAPTWTRAALAVAAATVAHAQSPPAQRAAPLPIGAVTLAPGSRFAVQSARNADYLYGLNNSRLMCLFTSAANMTGTFADPTCVAYDHPQCA